MTERKPREITFASWIDQQVSEAAERGAFDDLPGAGKPISRRGGTEAWLQDYLRREGVSADELLPTPLRLRKEVERLAGTVQDLPSEDKVREVVKGLNRRIAEWRRIPTGPPVYLRLVDEEAMVARWRDARRGPPSPAPPARPDTNPPQRRSRWWRRRQLLRPGLPERPRRKLSPARQLAGPAVVFLFWPRAHRPAVRTVAMPARRRPAGWRSARQPAAPRRRGRGQAGRCRRRPRG
jgi:hypothetical protein